MLETLVNFDHNIFLAINGMHCSFMDTVMFYCSEKFTWLPLYIFLAAYLYKNFGTQSLFMILFGLLLILLSDQGSVLVKNIVQRPRPCHNDSLSFLIHTVNNICGGAYGFVSSHAANSMALFTYILMLTRHKTPLLTWVMIGWLGLMGYCRVYMGVHYPADIIGGWIVGIIAASVTYVIYRMIFDSPQQVSK